MRKKNAILFFFALMLSVSATAQIYQHNFGNTPITANPYTESPSTFHPDLSNSSWTNNTGPWTSLSGSSGSIGLSADAPTSTISTYTDFTLTFDVASGKELNITSFNFWRRRTSGFVAPTWSMTINGIAVGNGAVPTTGLEIGETIVLNPVTGLTGTVTIIVRFNNSASGSGGVVIDDFTLNGTVTSLSSPCPLEITSFFPATGPENTLVTLTGTGFNNTTGVTFDGVSATFSPLSDTELVTLVPAGVTVGNIVVTTTDCSENVTGNFNLLTSECQGEIYISEIYDNNGGSYGAIELYNPTSNTVTFGGEYVLERAGDVGGPASYTLNLPGSIAPYSTYIVRSYGSGVIACSVPIDANMGQGINANDEFKLFKNGALIDIARAPNYIGYTVKRNTDAVAPTTTFNWSDWTVTSNVCSDLGMHIGSGSGTVPDITHPDTQYVCENASATFSVSVSGSDTYSYQWKVLNSIGNWVNVTNDANHSGATTNILDIQNIPFSFNGNQYYCEITSSTCELISNAAQLNITAAPVVDTAIATPTDCTSSTGTITITAVTPEFGLSYSIDGVNYTFTNTFTNLSNGDYTVTIRNLSGCESEPVTVTVDGAGAPDEAVTVVTQPTCNSPMGTIEITSPTDPGLEYSINGIDFQTSTTFSVDPGTYTVIVKNALDCTSETEEIVINALTVVPEATRVVTQPTCDVPSGTIEITGPAGYTYSIDGVNFDTVTLFENLTPGTYNITVKDSNECTSVSSDIVINAIPTQPVVGTVNVTGTGCNTNGQISILSPTGTGYTYSINGGISYQSSPNFNNVLAGTYQVMVQYQTCISEPEEVIVGQDSPSCIQNPNLTNDFPPSSDSYLANKGSWFTSHGTPSGSDGSIWMWSYNGNTSGEGTYTCFNFEAGKEYRICINLENDNDPGTLGYTNPDALFYVQATNGSFSPRPVPPANQVIAGWHAINQTPTDFTFTFTANDNYNKLWLFPYMQQFAPTGADQYMIRIFSVKVEEVIPDPVLNVAGNVATITGTPDTGGYWSWVPAEYVTSQNTDNSIVTLSESCPTEIVTATFISDCEVCSTYTVQTNTIPGTLPAPTVSVSQPNCIGNPAQIEVTAPLATGNTYSIGDGNGYQSSPIFNDVPVGNYQVTVQDASGCITQSYAVTINEGTVPPADADISYTHPGCGETTGTITITAQAGSGIEYSIDNGTTYQTSNVFAGYNPGDYDVLVRNDVGCVSNVVVATINDAPPTPTDADVSYTHPGCGETTGTITITAQTGSGIEYSIDNGTTYQASNVFAGYNPGNYNVLVRNDDGCVSNVVIATINDAPLTPTDADISYIHPTCTEATGTITITPQTGSGIEYSIDNGVTYQSSNVFAGYNPGDYDVLVRNDDGCVSNVVVATINNVPPLPTNASVSYIHPGCGETTGTITVAVQSGSGIEYSIDNGATYQTSNVFAGYNSGNYEVVVRNDDGCVSNTVIATINDAPLTPTDADVSLTHPGCGETTGTITITAQTGSGIEYSIDNGTTYQSSNVFAGYNPSDYNVLVRNSDGCVSNVVIATINDAPPTPTDADISYIHPTCTEPTGTITITAQTGSGIEYSIDNGVTYQTSNVFTGYNPGDYEVVVRNDDGCVSNAVTATINDAPTIPAPQYQASVLGCNETTGTIEITAPTGSEYTYSIDNGPYQASTTFAGYTAGNYTITVQNTDGCVSTATATINPAPSIPDDADVSFTQPSCSNPFGSITINSISDAGLTYSINNGATYQNTTNYTGLPAGNYAVLVKNAAGCVSANPQMVVINSAPPVPTAAGYISTNPTCSNPTGSITITSPTGINLEYSIDNGNTYSTNLVYNNLTPGLYQIVVRNTVGGCNSPTVNVTISPAPNVPDDAVVITNQPGCNSTAGSITIQSPIGTGYSYSIDGVNYQPLTTFYGIAPGNYFAYVKNAAGCISAIPTPFTIDVPPVVPVPATVTVTNPDCTTPTGTLEVTAPLGADLTYTIDGVNYQASPVFANLAPGNYTIRVQNADGCISLPVTRTIQPQPATPEVPTLVVTQTDCFSDTGRIVVTSPIGIGYTYSIDGGVTYQGTTVFTNLAPNDYIITVRNSAGCTQISETITIDTPPAPAPDPGVITGNNEICEGETTQLADTVVDGVWSSSNENIATVDENGLVTSLKAGVVTISYTVGTECTDAATITVRVNAIPTPALEDIYYICQNVETEEYSEIMINSGLSIGNHSFVWKKGDTILPFISGFILVNEPGEYSVEATNLTTGCVGTATTTVGVSSIAVATAEVATDFQYNQTITVNVTGGSGDYEFSLNNGPYQDENIFTNITEGLYTITINDKNGCDPLVLEVYALNYPRFFSPNGDGQHETWNIKGLSNQKEAIIYIFDRYGKVVSVVRPGQVGWDGTYNGERLPATDYWFTLLYQSSNGTNKEFKAHFSLLR